MALRRAAGPQRMSVQPLQAHMDVVRMRRRRVKTLPIRHTLTFAYRGSFAIAALIAVVSAAGLLFGSAGLSGPASKAALGVTEAEAGLLVPGFLALDMYNLVVGLPILLTLLWLTHRGSLIGLLLWPGALFYMVYTYALYLVGAPFSVLFLAYVAIVAVSGFTLIGVVASIDGEQVRQRCGGAVPARTIGAILIGLAILTLAQDASGAVITALAGGAPLDPLARHVWLADLTLEVPAMLLGGALLWRHKALGYVAGAGLLLQFGLTPTGLAAIIAFQPILTAAPLDVGIIVGLLIFSLVCFASLAFFVRGAIQPQHSVAPPIAGAQG
jgi:hypothetical protein